MAIQRDPEECRQRALVFAKRAANCASPEARERFARIAKNWMEFAGQFMEADETTKKKHKGGTPR